MSIVSQTCSVSNQFFVFDGLDSALMKVYRSQYKQFNWDFTTKTITLASNCSFTKSWYNVVNKLRQNELLNLCFVSVCWYQHQFHRYITPRSADRLYSASPTFFTKDWVVSTCGHSTKVDDLYPLISKSETAIFFICYDVVTNRNFIFILPFLL